MSQESMSQESMSEEKSLGIRLPLTELEILDAHCQLHSRTKTEVLREFIRSLDPKSHSEIEGIDWQQVALANLQLYSRLASDKFFFETNLTLELDGLKRLFRLWLEREDVPLDQKKALIQMLAQLIETENIRM